MKANEFMEELRNFNRPQLTVLFAMMAANVDEENQALEFHLDLNDYMDALKLANALAAVAKDATIKHDARLARDYIIKHFDIVKEY